MGEGKMGMEIHILKEKSDFDKLPEADQKIITKLIEEKKTGIKTSGQILEELDRSEVSLKGREEFHRQLAEVVNQEAGEEVGKMLELSENEDFQECIDEYEVSSELANSFAEVLSLDKYRKIVEDKRLMRVAVKALTDVSRRTKRQDSELFKATLDNEIITRMAA